MSYEGLYDFLLSTPACPHWERIGLHRRAGVAAPLFSLHSARGAGTGELRDLELLTDWCLKTGLTVIQLLPMNDVGYDFQPYSAQSSFALEPLYLSPDQLVGVGTSAFQDRLRALRAEFPAGRGRVDYRVKGAKMDLLWRMFQEGASVMLPAFERFRERNRFWLEDYALFKVIKEERRQAGWESWEEPLKRRHPDALEHFRRGREHRLLFHQWVQWQLFEQFKAAKDYAAARGVLIMGDIPFLVSRDSADVWTWSSYFKMDRLSGAPPDAFFALGQRWGMPPMDWDNMSRNGYDYLAEKLRYSQNFYDMFRIDHVVGTYRLWTISASEPPENGGLNGVFDPADENQWADHGRKLLTVMLSAASMLPCGEDLGVVPTCSDGVLRELGITGMEVQRWKRDWNGTLDFVAPEKYRPNALATAATHDTTTLRGWWEYECGTVDEVLFRRKCEAKGMSFDWLKDRLFDPEKSRNGRLWWRAGVGPGDLPRLAERGEGDLGDILSLCRETWDERRRFWAYVGLTGEPSDKAGPEFVRQALRKAGDTAAIFSIHLLQDWLALGGLGPEDPWRERINFPGTVGERNWSYVMPLSLEEMQTLPVNEQIRQVNAASGRSETA